MTFTKKQIPWNKGKKLPQFSGKNHPNWKEDIGYGGIHQWIYRKFGKANKCENSNCTKTFKKFEWALIKGKKMQRKRNNFCMLCISCHRKYDVTENGRRKMSIAKKGYPAPNPFKKGSIPWNKGKQHPKVKGANNPNWVGGKKEVICKNCGIHFFVWNYLFIQGRKFCNNKCHHQSLTQVPKAEKLT